MYDTNSEEVSIHSVPLQYKIFGLYDLTITEIIKESGHKIHYIDLKFTLVGV
jgi:hypothetical protein